MELWGTLVPLAIASAVVPLQIVATLLMLRASWRTAAAWVAGMTATRLAQGLLFGFVFSRAEAAAGGGSGTVAALVLLALAVLFYVMAASKALKAPDDDAPPPAWMEKAGSLSPLAAFGAGAAYMAVAVKFWAFTLAAIDAIAEAHLAPAAWAGTYVVYVLLAQSVVIGVLAYAAVAPRSSAATLAAFTRWLERNNRAIVIVLGLVFGTWFLYKALVGLGAL